MAGAGADLAGAAVVEDSADLAAVLQVAVAQAAVGEKDSPLRHRGTEAEVQGIGIGRIIVLATDISLLPFYFSLCLSASVVSFSCVFGVKVLE
jgi:hypothetical protein